jgi:predicted enzyme related to lactoylglutathione lyase
MGQPVVHFEVIGKDGDKLQRYYSELFGSSSASSRIPRVT